MSGILQLDRTVFIWINTDWSNAVFDTIMPWVSHLGDAITVWLWIAFIGWQLAHVIKTGHGNGQSGKIMNAAVFFCLYMALIYGVNAALYNGLKNAFHRSRPFVQEIVTLRVSPTTAAAQRNDDSFPSGHASNAFMIAALLADRLGRGRYGWYGMASLVALSRIYLGVHYPSDVLVGSCLGLSVTWLMLSFRPLRNRITRENLFVSKEGPRDIDYEKTSETDPDKR
jgi:undecaprenyl-diphosphatase